MSTHFYKSEMFKKLLAKDSNKYNNIYRTSIIRLLATGQLVLWWRYNEINYATGRSILTKEMITVFKWRCN